MRDGGHATALEKAVLASFSAAPPRRRKQRRPPSAAALAEAARLRGTPGPPSGWPSTWPPMRRSLPADWQRRTVTQSTMSEARRYQQLRAHLCYLKLNDAAEVLPRISTKPAPSG